MERIQDLTTQIRSRFANPLLLSFGCSWVIFNWQIVVALLWFNESQLEKAGSDSIFDFISHQIESSRSFWYPLLFAIGYTLLMPLIKNLLRALYSWFNTWGENWDLKISKGGKIPMEKYIKLRMDYNERAKRIEEIITTETEITQKYDQINSERLNLQEEKNQLQQRLTEFKVYKRQLHEVSLLNGYWTNTYKDKRYKDLNGREDIFIDDGKYYTIVNGEHELAFNIKDFTYDSEEKTIFFTKERVDDPNIFEHPHRQFQNINRLQFKNSDLLAGTENETVKIEYRKMGGTS